MLGRLGARRAGGAERGGAEPRPRASAAGAGPGATAASSPPPLRSIKGRRGRALPALSRRLPPAPSPLSPPPPPRPPSPASAFVTRRGARPPPPPGRSTARLGAAGGRPPSRGPPSGRAGAQAGWRAPFPALRVRSLPCPPPFRGSRTQPKCGRCPWPGGRAREGGGPPIKIQREDGEKQRRLSVAHLACRRRAARLPGPRFLRSPAPPRPRARKDSCRGHPASTRPGKLCRIRPLESAVSSTFLSAL